MLLESLRGRSDVSNNNFYEKLVCVSPVFYPLAIPSTEISPKI